MKQRILMMISILAFFTPLWTEEPDFSDILREIDKWENFTDTDLSFTWNLLSVKPGKDPVRNRIRVFRRDSESKSLWVMLEPVSQKGQATLILDENIWYYDPESRQTVHESLKTDIGDMEIKNEDVQPISYVKNYRVVSHEESTLGEHPVYVLSLEATSDRVSYPLVKLWITREERLVLKEEEYGLSGRLMRSSQFGRYRQVGDHRIPTKILFEDKLNEGEKTLAQAEEISTKSLGEGVFTRAYLENLSK
jgi:hypothetical protein